MCVFVCMHACAPVCLCLQMCVLEYNTQLDTTVMCFCIQILGYIGDVTTFLHQGTVYVMFTCLLFITSGTQCTTIENSNVIISTSQQLSIAVSVHCVLMCFTASISFNL